MARRSVSFDRVAAPCRGGRQEVGSTSEPKEEPGPDCTDGCLLSQVKEIDSVASTYPVAETITGATVW